MEKRYFVTLEPNRYGRGIFTNREGIGFSRSEAEGPHSEAEMFDILGLFYLVLAPRSELFTEEEVKEHRWFQTLAEYSYQYGLVLKEKPCTAISQPTG